MAARVSTDCSRAATVRVSSAIWALTASETPMSASTVSSLLSSLRTKGVRAAVVALTSLRVMALGTRSAKAFLTMAK